MHNYCASVTESDLPPLKHTRIDARALRVLAHPLRTRLLGLLRIDGPATATTLARALDTNTGATSYHLRKLAEVGLVEESPGEGTRRERVWRPAHDVHAWSVSDFAGDPDAEAAREWLESEYFSIFLDNARRWAEASPTWPVEWRDAADSSDAVLWATPEELTELGREIRAVVERHQAAGLRAREQEPDEPERRRTLLYLHVFPDVRGPRGEAR
jgi:DNA-binding transcriptional ArsR family regulator